MIHRVKNRVEERVAVIVLKDTAAYRDWLQGVSQDSMIPMAVIARDAIRDWAISRGYPPPPTRCRFAQPGREAGTQRNTTALEEAPKPEDDPEGEPISWLFREEGY